MLYSSLLLSSILSRYRSFHSIIQIGRTILGKIVYAICEGLLEQASFLCPYLLFQAGVPLLRWKFTDHEKDTCSIWKIFPVRHIHLHQKLMFGSMLVHKAIPSHCHHNCHYIRIAISPFRMTRSVKQGISFPVLSCNKSNKTWWLIIEVSKPWLAFFCLSCLIVCQITIFFLFW
jgi:hypothetical protein